MKLRTRIFLSLMFFRFGRFGKAPEEIKVYSYPRLIFVFPLIVTGYVFAALNHLGWLNHEFASWFGLTTLFLIIMALGLELSIKATCFWLLFVSFCWLGTAYLRLAMGINIFHKIGEYLFLKLDPSVSVDFWFLLSIIFTPIYLMIWIASHLDSQVTINHSEIIYKQMGGQRQIVERETSELDAEYPNTLAKVLCGAGSLIMIYSRGQETVRKVFHNVPWLWFTMPLILEIIRSKEVITAEQEGKEKVEEEEIDVTTKVDEPPAAQTAGGRSGSAE